MKWIRRTVGAFAILACVLAGAVYFTALEGDQPVGFQGAQVKAADGHSFAIGIWYPTQARTWPLMLGPLVMNVAHNAEIAGRDLPLVVISHGNGGGMGGHADLALALASAGYVVAAPMHAGDNFADQSSVGSAKLFSGRNRELHASIDYLLKTWPARERINAARIGAFGFSAGGFTVLTAVGGQPDLSIIAQHCAATQEFVCDVLRHANSPLLNAETAKGGNDFLPDARIKAAVVAAPGLGFTFGTNGLANVKAAIQLWSGEQDDKVPYASNAKLVQTALGEKVEFHSVPGAGHMSFLVPCGLLKPPGFCADPGDFDRRAFHSQMNASVVGFFDKNLKKP